MAMNRIPINLPSDFFPPVATYWTYMAIGGFDWIDLANGEMPWSLSTGELSLIFANQP